MHPPKRLALIALATSVLLPLSARSQSPTANPKPDSTATKPAAPRIDFSGLIFANFQYRGERGPAQSTNKFDVERAYLTFRMPAGDRTSIRVTTDLFQQTGTGSDSYYRGWVVRAKYAYLQHNYLAGADWKANVRLGLLQTVFIEQDEVFWPRWISTSPTERAGYFSSADAGLSTTLSLPKKIGEVYATVTNGPGYTSRETDRFKDYAARLTLTPFASGESTTLRSVALTGWYYKGATASRFVTAGTAEIGSIGSALDRDRWGMHAGIKDTRVTAGLEYAQRKEDAETGLNTTASPRIVTDSTGTLVSGYATVRPLVLFNKTATSPLSLIARFDRVVSNRDRGSKYNVVIGGLIWDLSSNTSFSLDYQETTPVTGNPVAPVKTYFAHFVARF